MFMFISRGRVVVPALFLATLLGLSFRAEASLVTTGIIPITISGQNSIINTVAPSLWSSGTGTLSFEGKGDFDGPEEQVDLYLDNIYIGTAGSGLPGSTLILGPTPGMTGLHQLNATFTVSAPIMQTILGAKTNLTFRMDLASTVGGDLAFTSDYITASLAYSSVPEPTSLAMVGFLCGCGMGIRRLRRRPLAS